MQAIKQSNFKIQLKLGFQPVVIYNVESQRYALGLLSSDQTKVDGLLSIHNHDDQVKWQNRFPISDLLRFDIKSATLKLIPSNEKVQNNE